MVGQVANSGLRGVDYSRTSGRTLRLALGLRMQTEARISGWRCARELCVRVVVMGLVVVVDDDDETKSEGGDGGEEAISV